MSTKRPTANPPKTVVADDPDNRKGRLTNIGGSQSDHWNNILANQAVQALWLKNSSPDERGKQLSATVAALIGIAPKDELEGMMAAQLVAAHNAAMECYGRAMIGEQTFEGRRENLAQANKLSRTYAALLEALNRHRGKGQQKVTVEHVHVHAGGQAVVGMVAAPGQPGGGDAISYRWDATEALGEDVRFKNYGLAPKSAADFAFLLHGFHYLDDQGVMAIILPHGVLFRGGAEERIRTKLLKDGHIETVIGLPANLFYSTGIPVCILVLKRCKKPDDVLFINASGPENFTKGKRQNYMTDEHIARIIDLKATHAELVSAERHIVAAAAKHNVFLNELGLPPLPSVNPDSTSRRRRRGIRGRRQRAHREEDGGAIISSTPCRVALGETLRAAEFRSRAPQRHARRLPRPDLRPAERTVAQVEGWILGFPP